MELRTLANTPLAQITAAFNEAFSDYFIPLRFTEEGMASKIKSEGIVPAFSVGAFDCGQLVGFILHGYDVIDGVKTLYNAGTGVIPAGRGAGLTTAMYRYCIPLLKEQGIYTHLLEVIDNNFTAKKIYDAIGFETVRKLSAFRSAVPIGSAPFFAIRPVADLPGTGAFISMQPAWQNATAAINRDREGHGLLGAFKEETLVGYAAYVPESGRVKQAGVLPAFRRQGVGKALFRYMQQHSSAQLVVTNVDDHYEPAARFLEALGFQKILGLYEMRMKLS